MGIRSAPSDDAKVGEWTRGVGGVCADDAGMEPIGFVRFGCLSPKRSQTML